jgi:pimeloyl-ACP methyl ester carboxylesterase
MNAELVEKLLAIHAALKAHALPHAFGGAIALAYCVQEPRGTRDLDVNVFVDAAKAAEVLAALPDGVRVADADVGTVVRDGQCRLFWDGVPVDIFLNNLPLHEEVANGVVWVDMQGTQIPVLDCASLVIFKSFFARTRDWGDIEEVALATPEDVDAAVKAVAGLVGEDDPSFKRLAAISAANPP